MTNLNTDVFSIENDRQLQSAAMDLFHYQAENVGVYAEYLSALKLHHEQINTVKDIPFLPIEFFKSRQIISTNKSAQTIFSSSGTTGVITSQHFVADLTLYKESFTKCFNAFYGDLSDYCMLALLPSYLEREGSSLVYMADDLIKQSKHPSGGFYLNNYQELSEKLKLLRDQKQKTILLGVTYALLDLAEQFPVHFPELIIMETGGMKGKRKEMVRVELHEILCNAFAVSKIHSEYGMTELLSQAYSKGDGLFRCPPWMKILIRDTNDPKTYLDANITGAINVIDLANVYSCAFIATQDLGNLKSDGSFEVLGRFDNSDIRGCNLMVE